MQASIARGHPEDAVNSNSNKKTLSIVAAVVAEKQFQATTLEIPEKRLPLCGQWNNLHNYKAILEISIVICAAFLIISLLDQYKSVCHVYKNGSKLRFFVSSVTDLSKTY